MKRPNSGSGSNNTNYGSYQNSGSGNYQPPVHYAADQTKTLQDTTKAYYQADETAQNILNQMEAQRQTIVGGHNDVYEMREATEKARREMTELQAKYRAKKQRLYLWIAMLSMTDLLLFFRIIQCRGSFFCF